MKIKIQLMSYRDKKALAHKISELEDLAELFQLQLEKAQYDHLGDTFVVQLPEDVLYASVQQHAVASFCFLKGHTFAVVKNSYPSERL
ncbi:MAG TPA: hypothetical protein VK050_08505 [Flavobacteriaceae bacterium]|nr:hypothetical protein [Flavobacteriaceae bacterium]